MYKSFLIILLMSASLLAQTFLVEKIGGKVSVQKGMSEKWVEVKQGDKLSDSDLISTGNNSSVQLNKDKNKFVLKSNSALNLSAIRKISLNDLLLALTREEVKDIPKRKGDSNVKTTAVYGTENNGKKVNPIIFTNLGKRKLNGAKQLAEAGFKESSVLVSKETFRKYPETQNLVSERIYFANLLESLSLYEEAYTEYTEISNLDLNKTEREILKNKMAVLLTKLE